MRLKVRLRAAIGLAAMMACSAWGADDAFHIPFEKYKLPNGLRVVLARDSSVPVVAVYLLYDVGARSEEKGHTGFAHLFEHMMFEGSANVKKGEHFSYVSANGGETNGSTHPDYTDFYETLPSNRLALGLWLESDRMRSLKITEENLKTQKEAVAQERRRNYDTQPYRAVLADQWPQFIYGNFSNAHSVIGTAEDLEHATVDDVAAFFHTYYAPNNAVLVIAGDFDPANAKKLVSGYFADIPAQAPPKRPSLAETPRANGKVQVVKDPAARLPALVIGYPGPPRHSPEWYGLNVADAVLTSGETARLKLDMVKGSQSLLQADSALGWPGASPLDYKEPGYYAAILVHKANFSPEEVANQFEREIYSIARDGVGRTELERVKAVMRFAKENATQTALSKAKVLGIAELMDGDAGYAEKEYANQLAVTSEQIAMAVRKYLVPARRDFMVIQPAPPAPAGTKPEAKPEAKPEVKK